MRLLVLAFLLPALTLAATTHVLEGKVVGVHDGDTINVLSADDVKDSIRLAGIDAPELDQPFGQRSRKSLSNAVMGKEVKIVWSKRDAHGRIVGTVWVAPPDATCKSPPCPQTLDVNLAQLTVGLAWHYKQYANEQPPQERERYAFAEQEARARKAGLWSEPDPTPPWDWRHGTAGGPVKKATASGICHVPGTSGYSAVKHFTPYPTLDECLASGGRLPKGANH